ncbi:MAG: LptF/LptG family permease [Deltaproteobacteria bacterium]|nr:LptF/LptG family permease [Deltaproteobacteria bacterium]
MGGWLAALVAVYAIADATDLGSRGAPAPWSAAPLRLFAMAFQSLPVALAAAVAHTLSTMRQNGEWMGARASGAAPLRLAAPFLAAIAMAAMLGFLVGDRVAPTCARAFRSAGGGDPPGAVWLARSSGLWTRTPSSLTRAGPDPLVVRFPGHGRRPRIEARATPRDGSPALAPATDLELARVSEAGRRAPDPLPYAIESCFRPLTAAAAFLVPVLVLALLFHRAAGPRVSALVAALCSLAAYAGIALSYNLALGGLVAPLPAALSAAAVLGAAALGAAVAPTRTLG